MLTWPLLFGLLSVLFIFWVLIQIFLNGSKLLTYDQPIDSHAGSRRYASLENQQALRLTEQVSAEFRAAPRRERLAVIRRLMAQGFCEPPLLAGDTGYRIEAVTAGGVSGEWVLGPHSDPASRLLYLHGGSFISGCPRGHRVITTELARVTGASVLALDYRLMPEHRRRELIADCQVGYRWLLDNGPDGPAPARELFIAGDSAGGGLALMLAAWARDQGVRAADGVVALSPGVDMTFSSPTLKSNRPSDRMLGPSLENFLRLPRSFQLLLIWAVNRMIPPNPLISPIFGDLARLPPVLIQASEAEMLLGDARRYVNKARASGTQAELETWPGMLHVWHLFAPILPEAQEALERIGQFVERCRALTAGKAPPERS